MMSSYDDDDDLAQLIDRAKLRNSLDFELVIRMLTLPEETRAKMLAFLHLTDDLRHVKGDLTVNANEDVSLRLFNPKGFYADRQHGCENGVEQLQ